MADSDGRHKRQVGKVRRAPVRGGETRPASHGVRLQ